MTPKCVNNDQGATGEALCPGLSGIAKGSQWFLYGLTTKLGVSLSLDTRCLA